MLLIFIINLICRVLIYLILARAICSWFIRPGDALYPIYQFLWRVTEPLIAPCRRLLGRFGTGMGLDFSPILALIIIAIVRKLLTGILVFLLF